MPGFVYPFYMCKKIVSVLLIALICICSVYAFEIHVGAGLKFDPINDNLFSPTALTDKDSWNFSVYSQYNWKHFGLIADGTIDYISKDYKHFTFDLGFDGRLSIKRFTLSLGATFPITLNNGKLGLDDIAFSSIPNILKTDRPLLLLWNTKIFAGVDYAITDRLSAGYRYSYICGKASSIGTRLTEMLASAQKGIADFIFTYQVL